MISRVLTFTNRLKLYKLPAWPTFIKQLPSRDSVVKNTLVCVVFCGAGDVLAQVSTYVHTIGNRLFVIRLHYGSTTSTCAHF